MQVGPATDWLDHLTAKYRLGQIAVLLIVLTTT